jgi:hypothetical protein
MPNGRFVRWSLVAVAITGLAIGVVALSETNFSG